MNLVLFDDALEHITRVHRVIRMDLGNALLVGVGGSGRQSVARLAAFTAGCEVFEITLSRGYGEDEFREDLKTLYHKLGLENKKVGMLLGLTNVLHLTRVRLFRLCLPVSTGRVPLHRWSCCPGRYSVMRESTSWADDT